VSVKGDHVASREGPEASLSAGALEEMDLARDGTQHAAPRFRVEAPDPADM
jgi:hypothetical protein